jgi:hypothetical protein
MNMLKARLCCGVFIKLFVIILTQLSTLPAHNGQKPGWYHTEYQNGSTVEGP